NHTDISQEAQVEVSNEPIGGKGILMAVITPLVFVADIVVMLVYHLQGGDATALVGGSAMLLLVFCTCLHKGIGSAFEDVGEYLKEGFAFGIRIFAPVIVIGGFFFLGSEGAAQAVFGGDSTGILTDIGLFLSEKLPLNKASAAITQSVVAVITGLDGSGFSGLPLVGATAATFSNAIVLDKEVLAALGQTITIWVGGGTLIPWAVVPVAAICNVSPVELVRKNFIPVTCGLVAVLFTAICLL
ncbi:MAG: citrate transporter, partial [Anaerotignaceae bacterium]